MPRLIALSTLLLLTSCYEPASTWSEKQGRYRPTDEVRREIINEEIDRRDAERRSGGASHRTIR